MAEPISDFARILRLLFKALRYASLLIVIVAALVIVRELRAGFVFFEGLFAGGGWAFLALAVIVGWLGLGRPVARYVNVPAALKQPPLPVGDDLSVNDVAKRLAFVARYVGGLSGNGRLEGNRGRIAEVKASAESLRREVSSGATGDAAACRAALDRFEREEVDPLLAPLDEEANRLIRQEALAVGLATAVSMNGTVDAFIVLWRNANLVARLAAVYHGRPGVRGSLMILRDVAAGMLVAGQVQGAAESMANLFGKSGVGLAGPLAEGGVNALATVRIGYVGKARCRAYRPWSDDALPDILKSVLVEAAAQGKGVVKDVIGTVVRGGVVAIPVEMAKKAKDWLGGLFGGKGADPEPA